MNGPFPRSGKKRPPPERGIKVAAIGATWWGTRWIEALERISRDYQKRMARGRTYARTGRVHDLLLEPGRVHAQVTGSGRTPYRVEIRLAVLEDACWRDAVTAMAERAVFAAALLAGEMPHAIDEAFGSARGLFPAARGDLATECSCPDWANPCKHVAATHYVLGEALDRDPFLLFELRGRSREQVLAALRGLGRGKSAEDRPAGPRAIALADRAAADYDRAPAPIPRMRFHELPEAPALAALAPPPRWRDASPPLEIFGGRLASAASLARLLAGTSTNPDDGAER
jgi:uncharacterized Zn finger protein